MTIFVINEQWGMSSQTSVLMGKKLNFEFVEAILSGIGQVFFDMRSRLQNFDCCHFRDQGFEKRANNESGMRCSEAKVCTKAERNVGVRLTSKVDLFRFLEDLRIKICGSPSQGNATSGWDPIPSDLSFNRADSTDVSERHKSSEKFFSGNH